MSEEVDIMSLEDGVEHYSPDSGDDDTSHTDDLVTDIQADLFENLSEVPDLHADQHDDESVIIDDTSHELDLLEVDMHPEMLDSLHDALNDDNSVNLGGDSHDSDDEHEDFSEHDADI